MGIPQGVPEYDFPSKPIRYNINEKTKSNLILFLITNGYAIDKLHANPIKNHKCTFVPWKRKVIGREQRSIMYQYVLFTVTIVP